MNPKIHALAPLVADLVDIRAQQAALAGVEAAIVATLRGAVSPVDVAAFREQYGALVVPAIVQGSAIPALPVEEWGLAAGMLKSWPLRAAVNPATDRPRLAAILDFCGPTARIDVPLTPLLVDGGESLRFATCLHAAPTPTVAAALRDAGDPRFAAFGKPRVDFRKPPRKGGDDDGS